ncbi:MAG TPA: diacylglycerol kinase family protein [Puia sp.]|nr:diacylglycerol kinase family protein [Puia sp.]
MQPERFSIRSRIKSFSHALAGLRQFVVREHNARIHVVATIGVIIAGLVLNVTRTEAAILAIVTGLVWVAEIINTCVERLADLITKERHPGIKIVKDLAAGAVLTAAITAVIVALFIFIPKII